MSISEKSNVGTVSRVIIILFLLVKLPYAHPQTELRPTDENAPNCGPKDGSLSQFLADSESSMPCPNSFLEWKNWRDLMLDAPNDASELLRKVSSTLDRCEKRKDQNRFFTDPQFVSCMKDIRETSAVYNKIEWYPGGFQNAFK